MVSLSVPFIFFHEVTHVSDIASISRQTSPVGVGRCLSLGVEARLLAGTGCLGIEEFSLLPCFQIN